MNEEMTTEKREDYLHKIGELEDENESLKVVVKKQAEKIAALESAIFQMNEEQEKLLNKNERFKQVFINLSILFTEAQTKVRNYEHMEKERYKRLNKLGKDDLV